jgi:G:T-mismatch repair DNA endonuclease (very short patch repair protein)
MKQRDEVEKVCKYCDLKYLTRANISHFCSKNCRIDHDRRKKENELLKSGLINIDYVICQICGSPVGSVTGQHLKKYHPDYSTESYKSEFPGFLTMSEKLTASVTAGAKNAGARMREPEHRARLSNSYFGENNPMHRSKTTDEKRKSVSPFSPNFYLKKDPNISIDAAKKLASKKLTDTKIVSWVKKEYWMNKGMSEKDAISTVSKKQKTFSLDICIEKHGEIEGKKIWLDRQSLWKSKVFNENTHIGGGRSMIADELISTLIDVAKLLNIDTDILHGKNEKFIKTNDGNAYKYDLTFNSIKKIIEFNGDYWHCNPNLYSYEYINKVKMISASDIWEYDRSKIAAANKHGYEVLTIWELDYRKDPKSQIKKCIDFIYGNT